MRDLKIIDKVYLNSIPILIFLVSIIGIYFLSEIDNNIFKIVLGISVFFLLCLDIKLFNSYSSKKRSINILYKENSKGVNISSFKEYMKAPCGRQVVKIVLKEIKKRYLYKLLKNRYKMVIFDLMPRKSKIIFFKNNYYEKIKPFD